MKLAFLPLITGLLPVIAVVIAYVTAAGLGHVPACIPFVEGCTTISATGRTAPESLLFRATMIPAAVLMMIYWRLNGAWLVACGDRHRFINRLMFRLGATAAVFLIVYTVALGFIGDYYALQRRIGVTLFFALTYMAQLLFLHRVGHLLEAGHRPEWRLAYRAKVGICLLMLLLGLAISPLKAIYPDEPHIENIIEWNFALLMYLFFILTWPLWRTSGFAARFSVRDDGAAAGRVQRSSRRRLAGDSG